MDDLFVGDGGELRQRLGPHELVLHDRKRDRHAGHPSDRRAPDPGADQDLLALDVSLLGPDAVHPAVPDVEAGHPDATLERDALLLSLRGERRRHPGALGNPVRGHEVGPQDVTRVEDRDPLGGLLGREQLRPLDPVTRGRSHAVASARPSARGSSRPRCRRRRTRRARRRPRAPNTGRRSTARGGTSSASRSSGTRVRARARSIRRSRTAAPDRSRGRRSHRARPGDTRRSSPRSRRRSRRAALDPS